MSERVFAYGSNMCSRPFTGLRRHPPKRMGVQPHWPTVDCDLTRKARRMAPAKPMWNRIKACRYGASCTSSRTQI